MDKQSKPGVTTGSTPSSKTAKGLKELAPRPIIQVQRKATPVSNNAPILEGLKPSKSGLAAVKILLGDFLAVINELPRSWIGAKDGKIYICIDPNTGKFQFVDGKLYYDAVPVDIILETNTGKTE